MSQFALGYVTGIAVCAVGYLVGMRLRRKVGKR